MQTRCEKTKDDFPIIVTKELFEEFLKLAKNGCPINQSNVAVAYWKGEGVAKNMTSAVEWFTRSAESGYALAQFNLAWCYYSGDGVPKADRDKAIFWFKEAAMQKHSGACFNLGLLYLEKNKNEAMKWFRVAASQGHEGSIKELAEISPPQIPEVIFPVDESYYLGYDLCLVSGRVEPEIGKLYLQEKNGCIAYTVITPEKKVVSDVVIDKLAAPQPFDLQNLEKLREQIFQVTAKAGHTHHAGAVGQAKIVDMSLFRMTPSLFKQSIPNKYINLRVDVSPSPFY